MAYITREDGEHFVIPSYRDVLSAKKESLLKREITLLSQDYGEYITLQRKSANQYEIAFSNEPGYLLGESIWNYFKRPQDLVYCEAIPNTFEAILVIVKSGSVFLDGSFPIDSIPDELLIFRSQQNNFDIYTYGDVPISQVSEEGKFAFNTASVKSFKVLDKPVFPTLPVSKAFQLQLVSNVLKSKGIGVLPLKKILLGVVLLGLAYVAYQYFSTHEKELPQVILNVSNPYQGYVNAMSTPNPADEIHWLANESVLLNSIPGWQIVTMDYANGQLRAGLMSQGGRTNLLYDWARQNNAAVDITTNGIYLVTSQNFSSRYPVTISQLNRVMATIVDALSYVYPGNNLTLKEAQDKGKYIERQFTINFNNITPDMLDLIGRQLRNLPLVLMKVTLNISSTNGSLSGSIDLKALGN